MDDSECEDLRRYKCIALRAEKETESMSTPGTIANTGNIHGRFVNRKKGSLAAAIEAHRQAAIAQAPEPEDADMME